MSTMTKPFYHNIDLVSVSQLLNARIHNIADATAENALAGSLGVNNAGLIIYRADTTEIRIWDGDSFISISPPPISGDVIFRGILNDLATTPTNTESGSQYVIGTAGTLTFAGVSFTPSAVVEIGDTILFTSPTEVYVFQKNDLYASTTTPGNIRLATQSEANAGTDALAAITPATLQGKLVNGAYSRAFVSTVNLVADTPLNVAHNLNLADRNGFTVNAMLGNSQISVDVDSVSVNELTITSSVSLTAVVITIQGASAA